MSHGLGGAALACIGFFAPRAVSAQESSLTATDRAALNAGTPVAYPTAIDRGERRFIGGIVYARLPASRADAYALFKRRERFVSILPKLRATRLMGEMPPDTFIEFEYGGNTFHSAHTMRVRYDDDAFTVQFWID